MTDDQREALMAVQAAAAKLQLQIDYLQSLLIDEESEDLHGWSDAEFDEWWESLSHNQKNGYFLGLVSLPQSLSLPDREDYDYWNRRAIKRSRRYNESRSNPTKRQTNGMIRG